MKPESESPKSGFVANGHNIPTISYTLEFLENEELILRSNFFSLSSKSGFYFRKPLGYEINAPKVVGHWGYY